MAKAAKKAPVSSAARPRLEPSRVLDLSAAAAGVLVAAAIYAPRLPPSTDFILPRRFGFMLFETLIELWTQPWAATALSSAAMAAAAVCVGALAWDVTSRLRAEPKTLRALSYGSAALRGAVVAVAAAAFTLLARLTLSSALDIIENAWFMPEALDWREPLVLAMLFSGCFIAAFRASAGFAVWVLLGPTRPRAFAWLSPAGRLVAAAAVFVLFSAAFYDADEPDLDSAAAVPESPGRTRLVAVLSNDEGGPQTKVHEVPFAPEQLSAVEAYLDRGRRTVYARAALAQLYAGYTVGMDPEGLRRALLRGVAAGDGYARVILLEHLLSAAPDEDARHALEALSDEKHLRIGPKAAARLAQAWARHGEGEMARRWLARVSQGRGSLPPGLVELPERFGPLKPGRLSGRLRAPGETIVALYARRDALQPSLLGPGQLAAAAAVGKDGRFRFSGLPAGSYYLAAALTPSRPIARERLRARGRRGDLALSARRASIDDVVIELGE